MYVCLVEPNVQKLFLAFSFGIFCEIHKYIMVVRVSHSVHISPFVLALEICAALINFENSQTLQSRS